MVSTVSECWQGGTADILEMLADHAPGSFRPMLVEAEAKNGALQEAGASQYHSASTLLTPSLLTRLSCVLTFPPVATVFFLFLSRSARSNGRYGCNEKDEVQKLMNLSFENKVSLVTGAASGMGLATAKAFAEAGAAVMLADFREEAVKAEAQRLIAAGHKAIAIRCDVSDEAQVAAMVDRTVAEFGRLDAAFNNAGVMARIAPTADSTYEEWERVT
jgi:hypothetical protein